MWRPGPALVNLGVSAMLHDRQELCVVLARRVQA